MIPEQFREIVNDRLAELGWSRSDLARAAGISPQDVTHLLNGRRDNPRAATIDNLIEALGLDLDLVARERFRPAKPPLHTAG